MAHLYRLALCVLLGMCSLPSSAAVGYWGWANLGAGNIYARTEARNAARLIPYTSAEAACAAYVSAIQVDQDAAAGDTRFAMGPGYISAGTVCVVPYKSWQVNSPGNVTNLQHSQNMIFTEGSPSEKANEIATSLGKEGELCALGTGGLRVCYQGYIMKGSWSGTASMGTGTNNGFCVFGPFTSDGTACTGAETGTPSSAPTPCTGGKVPGSVNGVQVCVDPGTTSAPGDSSSGTNSGTDGNGNSTGSGSSSSGKNTTCTGDTCTTTTTTTTTTAGGGTGTSTTSTTQPKSTFCAENPTSPLCAAGSFAGSCGAAPACTGDAVQCAQARYVFETSCSLAKPSDTATEFTAFDQALQAGTGDQTKNLEGNSTVNIGIESFDRTELLGAGAGLTDMVITVAGQAVELPFSILNDWFVRLGQVLVAVTFLLCIRIVTRG